MSKKLIVGVIAGALLASGALVGVSFAGSGGITEPQEIALSTRICGSPGPCRYFPLREGDRNVPTGQITVAKNPLTDVDGNRVGHVNTSCIVSVGPDGPTNWVCDQVLTLRAGPYTASGTVVATGLYGTGDDNVDVHAVTGGTGAYVNVRGYITQGPKGNFTLSLIP